MAADVPPDVAQKVLGHASLTTTTIYAQAEARRVRRELAGYFAQMQALTTSATAGSVEDTESGREVTPPPVASAGIPVRSHRDFLRSSNRSPGSC
ncbi:hypothetical protein J2797_005132 [Paraburkholderia terricola]|nr:hypothetical protein [Paraburkholderia terricola]